MSPDRLHTRDAEPAPLIIRPMQPCDALVVAEMARELASAVEDPEPVLDASDILRDGTGPERWFDCLVAVAAGEAVGYAMTCRRYEAHIGKRHLWLSDLYVRKQARGKGVGRALMIAVARSAIAQGCEVIHWDLWRANQGGRSFYQNLGGAESGDLAVWRVPSRALLPGTGG